MKNLLYTDIHTSNIYSFNIKRTKHLFSEYSRIDELYSTFNWIAEITKSLGIMMPINLGDTFHQALRFYVERYNFAVKSVIDIKDASLSKSEIVIEGNHDKTEDISAVDTFANISGIILVKNSVKIKYISEINSHFVFVPYIRDPEKTKNVFKALYEKFKSAKTNVYVFCHLDIKEALEGIVTSTYQMTQYNSYNDLHLKIYKAIFSGHMHFRKKIKDNFYYIGATLNHNFGDRLERKGVAIVDFSPDGYELSFKENPYCPLFVRINMQKKEDAIKKMKFVESEKSKHPYTNVYVRIYSLNNEKAREEASEFIRDYNHLFTFYETKSLDTEEEMQSLEEISLKIEHVNIFDMITDHGSKILISNGKTKEEIERHITRLKRICQLN